MARDDFGKYTPSSFNILGVDDQAAAVSHVEVKLYFEVENKTIAKQVSVRAIYQDADNNPSVRSQRGGHWRIVQNSFSKVIYAASL